MVGNDERDFIRFLSELLDFISRYDKAQLNKFYSMSTKKFQHFSEFIQCMIKSMDFSDVEDSISTIKNNLKPQKDLEITSLDEKLSDLLNSKKYFKTTQDVIDFSDKYLNVKIVKSHYTRAKIIEKISRAVKERDSQEIARIENVLGKLQENRPDNFFSGWEKIIKSIEL